MFRNRFHKDMEILVGNRGIDRDVRRTRMHTRRCIEWLLCISCAGYRCNILDIRVHRSRLSARTGSFVRISNPTHSRECERYSVHVCA